MTTKRREWWIDNDDNEIFSIKPIEIGRDCEYYHVTEIHPGESIVSRELLDRVMRFILDGGLHDRGDDLFEQLQQLRDVRAK